MSFALPGEAMEWRARLRAFVDEELIPWEVEAEFNGGVIPAEARARHRAKAQEFGLAGMDAPRERGGLALSQVTQVAITEQLGRVTNALVLSSGIIDPIGRPSEALYPLYRCSTA